MFVVYILGLILLGCILFRRDYNSVVAKEKAYLNDVKESDELCKVICFYEVRKIHHQDKLRRNA
jgi:hypothetical protein